MNTLLRDLPSHFAEIENYLSNAGSHEDLYQKIVDAPFSDKLMSAFLGLGIVVLLLNNNQEKTIDRIALSNTDHAKGALQRTAKPFNEIRIPQNTPDNIIAACVTTQKPQQTDDWQYLFTPELTHEEARMNQASAGIGCSFVYPLLNGMGAIIFSYFLHLEEITDEHKAYMQQLAELVSVHLQASERTS